MRDPNTANSPFKGSKQVFRMLSHEINNILGFSYLQLSILKRNVDNLNEFFKHYQELHNEHTDLDSKVKEIKALEKELDIERTQIELNSGLKIIEKAFKRIHNLSENLKSKDLLPHIEIDINQCITDTLSIVKANVDKRIKLKTNLSYLPPIQSYQGKFNQVFTNLIKNALEAIHRKEQLKDEFINIETSVQTDHIIITIQDSGIGMTEETQVKLFDSYYTTKTERTVHGVGLSVTKQIIEEQNGTIEIQSELGKGSTFIITLPISNYDK